MGQPIATVNCFHKCPMSDGNKPHVGGPILQGSLTVFVKNQGVARVGDQAQCHSPSLDAIQTGSNSVYVNGQAIARKGDLTQHGGTIEQGDMTVFAG